MAKKETIEAYDNLLQDLMDCNQAFGGKNVVFGGDFRQTLPIMENEPLDAQVHSSIVYSNLWNKMVKMKLVHNMQAILDPTYSEFLLRIGEGIEPVYHNRQIALPCHMVIPYENKEDSINRS